MAENFTLASLLGSGGPTLIILLLCSIISWIIIIERWLYFGRRRVQLDSLLAAALTDQGPGAAEQESIEGYVLTECLTAGQPGSDSWERDFEEIKGRAIAEKLPEMERYLNVEATLGTVSPYIGLLGTVFGIIQAFGHLGSQADTSGSMTGLNQGIAQALVATAGGLLVAIPATMAFNYFRKKVSQAVLRSEVAASRLKMALLKKAGL
ncbi:MAG: MotA/TolQ/ExbB proton channel family protein [Leptospiraceae bacterium]|nr:MotA/TolQ/ExbB proton channel family protein [Leptospiraceae bacterium]